MMKCSPEILLFTQIISTLTRPFSTVPTKPFSECPLGKALQHLHALNNTLESLWGADDVCKSVKTVVRFVLVINDASGI